MFTGAKYYVEDDDGFIATYTTGANWNHIVLPANYAGWVGVDVAEGLKCMAGHFQDQTFEGHDDTIYGLGFEWMPANSMSAIFVWTASPKGFRKGEYQPGRRQADPGPLLSAQKMRC